MEWPTNSLSRVVGVSVELFVAEPQRGVSLVTPLPMDDDQIIRLINPYQPRVADHVSGHNSGQPSFYALFTPV